MAGGIEAAEVAGHKPAIDDGFSGKLGLVEVTGHYSFAADRDFADPVGIGIEDADFHAGERFADGVGAKRVWIVAGDGGAGFGPAVPLGYGDPEIKKKMQRWGPREARPDRDARGA